MGIPIASYNEVIELIVVLMLATTCLLYQTMSLFTQVYHSGLMPQTFDPRGFGTW